MKLRLMLIFLWSANAFSNGAPVFDFANWLENGKIIVNQVHQYKTQIDQYNNQLQQYQNMLDNTKSLTSFQWDNANGVINNLLDATNTIDYYKQEAGSLQGYLDRFQTEEYYQKSPCFNGDRRCTPAEMRKINQNKMAASVAQKRANDAMLKGIDKQQQNLKSDSEKLRMLQTQAQGAQGQKQALQAASQLASNQSHQLLQIRGLLLAQQNAQATKDAAALNKEAIQTAGDERFRSGTYHKSSGKKW
ncbi:TPA: P-type conjugative transfer protein TrbJ [Legionella pneumophila subsp. pneumophila]|uniref:P-type conjugative transfer protein TrbJ n=1 Tax=Legionella pneumophila TaxID=446 RepID=UPI00015275A9|nr:P-type conjugative transfer protein TrbJ [Legionella pneumophila]ABQ54177.1 Conjugal transfer protein trbJ precursor [Legionella pneumophila str. Corby]ADG23414.1 Conjugal transfer protein trbJ precursor [Legionella pneumophila 2300/99 Alcoy]AOW58455.1 P-type conjugative transfer protein TrbJ [Legionella pneumophila subsp. pneumophila]AOW61361.1 P-type conjugative transfer protein TrbJ [Legionella pneumophila subsp. pneumophila]AOW66759.1 P-type conjugative transfer protein TrbJ [Legionella